MLSFWGDLLNLSTNSSNAEQNISGETIRFEPAIATSNDGSFVIAWEQQEGDVERVAVQIFNADGSKRGPQFIAPTSIGDSQSAPAVSFLANGNFILGWDALIPGAARDVNFQ